MLAAYRAQPLIKAYIHHPWSLWLGYPDSPISREHPIIGFRGSRADYIREYSWVPHNTDVLTVDGWWRESNGSALHAYCHPKSCPHQPPGPLSGRAARHTCHSSPTTPSWYDSTATADITQKLCQSPDSDSDCSRVWEPPRSTVG